jgi:hypothetical protein
MTHVSDVAPGPLVISLEFVLRAFLSNHLAPGEAGRGLVFICVCEVNYKKRLVGDFINSVE